MDYATVLKTMRTDPSIAGLGEDVRNIRRTRTGVMLLVLKKDVKISSNVYSDLAWTVHGGRGQA